MNTALRYLLAVIIMSACAGAAMAQQKNKTIAAKEKAHPENQIKQYWFVLLT